MERGGTQPMGAGLRVRRIAIGLKAGLCKFGGAVPMGAGLAERSIAIGLGGWGGGALPMGAELYQWGWG